MEDKEININDNALSGRFNQDNLLTLEKVTRRFMNMPSSEVTNLALNVMTAGKEQLGELPERKAATTHNGSELTIDRQGSARTITLSHQDEHFVSIQIDEVEKLIGNNKGARKMLVFILCKLNEQALNNKRELTNPSITFPLKELVELGAYKSEYSARKGVKAAMQVITSLKISASLKKGRKDTLKQDEFCTPFPYSKITNSTVIVDLNPRINWGTVATYQTTIPTYAFKLFGKSFDLIVYIFYIARQRTAQIEKQGSFNISMRAIHSRLMLPSEINNHDPARTIREPIERAIEQIEDAAASTEFTITPHFNEKGSIKDYLDNGYISVGLKGEHARKFIVLSKTTTKRIETAAKKSEAIRDKARAAALQKVIEAESKQA